MTSLLSDARLILPFLAPVLELSQLSKELWFLSMQNGILKTGT